MVDQTYGSEEDVFGGFPGVGDNGKVGVVRHKVDGHESR